MRRDPALDERLAEDILRGRTSALGDEHDPLVRAVEAIRHASTRTSPEPSAELRRIFAAGVEPEAATDGGEELAAAAASTAGRRPAWRLLPRVAGLSLVVKLALAGMAAGAIAGGAGASGILPGQSDDPGPPVEAEDLPDESDLGQETADEAVTEGGVEGRDVVERTREPRGDEGEDPVHRPYPGAETEIEPGDVQDLGGDVSTDARERGDEDGRAPADDTRGPSTDTPDDARRQDHERDGAQQRPGAHEPDAPAPEDGRDAARNEDADPSSSAPSGGSDALSPQDAGPAPDTGGLTGPGDTDGDASVAPSDDQRP